MEANELMPGDLVQIKDNVECYLDEYKPGDVILVKEILEDCINPNWIGCSEIDGSISFDEIEPIPLTPEILEKNGFFIGNDGEYWMEKEKGESVNVDKDNYAILEKGSSAIYLTCKYVHELQHALKLCCIHKEVIL